MKIAASAIGKKVGTRRQKMNATAKQIDYIKSLCQQTGYDPDEYNFATMTKDEASEIISEMLKEA